MFAPLVFPGIWRNEGRKGGWAQGHGVGTTGTGWQLGSCSGGDGNAPALTPAQLPRPFCRGDKQAWLPAGEPRGFPRRGGEAERLCDFKPSALLGGSTGGPQHQCSLKTARWPGEAAWLWQWPCAAAAGDTFFIKQFWT